MPFPNHPEKHRAEPLVTPEKNAEYKAELTDGEVAEPPEAVVLCYSRSLMEYVTETYDGEAVGHYFGDLYVLDDADHRVGVLGNFGIGAPTTALLMDEMIVDGVETFLSIGFAGCLDHSVGMGEFVVPSKAIRDEGTSHHYVESAKFAHPSDALTGTVKTELDARDEPYHVGPTWTTDAIYRETVAEVERYADEGVLTVEMEASAVFAVAAHRGVEAAATFVVSDYLGTAEWEPKFRLAKADLQRLGDVAVEILAAHVE